MPILRFFCEIIGATCEKSPASAHLASMPDPEPAGAASFSLSCKALTLSKLPVGISTGSSACMEWQAWKGPNLIRIDVFSNSKIWKNTVFANVALRTDLRLSSTSCASSKAPCSRTVTQNSRAPSYMFFLAARLRLSKRFPLIEKVQSESRGPGREWLSLRAGSMQ